MRVEVLAAFVLGFGTLEGLQEVEAPDRSKEIRLQWITDAGGEEVNRDSVVLLELGNAGDADLLLNTDVWQWLDMSMQYNEGRVRSFSRGTGEGIVQSDYFTLPPGRAIHIRVPFPRKDGPREVGDSGQLVAKIRVHPADVIYSRELVAPGGAGLSKPMRKLAGYSANVDSEPLGVSWEHRLKIGEKRAVPPRWSHWRDSIREFGRLSKSDSLRRTMALRAGLPEDASASVVSGLDVAMDQAVRVLGPGSLVSEADDWLFLLAAERDLRGAVTHKDRLLDLLMSGHRGSTGARRAREYRSWLDLEGGGDTYLFLGAQLGL